VFNTTIVSIDYKETTRLCDTEFVKITKIKGILGVIIF